MRLGMAIVFVSDMMQSIAFYRDVMDLPLKFETTHWTELDAEGATLALHLAERPVIQGLDPEHLPAAFCRRGPSVRNLSVFHQKMVEWQVRVIQAPKNVFGVQIAQYADPDGLGISVSELK